MRGTTCPSNYFWFQRFMRGYQERVGDLVKQNLGISSSIMVALMEKIADMHEQKLDQVKTVKLALYCMICYLGALRVASESVWGSAGDCVRLPLVTPNSLTL